ncbi:hypothetical protein HDU99_008849 [Rhizoclosmatium hyalinum]|nr:hypothetical protein HDU99_008849 [Rhizoclosmatium hyalinum]
METTQSSPCTSPAWTEQIGPADSSDSLSPVDSIHEAVDRPRNKRKRGKDVPHYTPTFQVPSAPATKKRRPLIDTYIGQLEILVQTLRNQNVLKENEELARRVAELAEENRKMRAELVAKLASSLIRPKTPSIKEEISENS